MAMTRRGATLKPIVRTSTRIDVARLSRAVQRPGIDPRTWVTMATVTSDPVVEDVDDTSDAGGVFVNVTLMPSGTETTAFLPAQYAGDGFGFYLPVAIDDTVIVVVPDGDPNNGCVITSVMWDPSAPPPQDAIDHPADVAMIIRPDKTARMKVSGGGNLVLACEDGKVLLGDETGTKPVARKDDPLTASAQMAAWAQVVETLLGAICTATGVPNPFTPANTFSGSTIGNPGKAGQFGGIESGSGKVEAS